MSKLGLVITLAILVWVGWLDLAMAAQKTCFETGDGEHKFYLTAYCHFEKRENSVDIYKCAFPKDDPTTCFKHDAGGTCFTCAGMD